MIILPPFYHCYHGFLLFFFFLSKFLSLHHVSFFYLVFLFTQPQTSQQILIKKDLISILSQLIQHILLNLGQMTKWGKNAFLINSFFIIGKFAIIHKGWIKAPFFLCKKLFSCMNHHLSPNEYVLHNFFAFIKH